MRRNRRCRRFFAGRVYYAVIASLPGLALAGPAMAHPHVWVTTQARVLFDQTGKVTAIRNTWVFDDMYSAFVTQGLADGDTLATKAQLAPLAKTNVESLAEFDYFTHAKAAGAKVAFDPPRDYELEERPDKRVVLSFTLPLQTPASAKKVFSMQIYDPTFFVDFEMEENTDKAIALAGAPSGCSASIAGANPLAAADTKKLSEAFFQNLSPGADFGIKLASRVIVACP